MVDQDRHEEVRKEEAGRKQYAAPVLTEFGTIEDLTQGFGGTDYDAGTGESTFPGL